MFDRPHPTNKHDVEIARVRRSTRITLASITGFLALATSVLAILFPPG